MTTKRKSRTDYLEQGNRFSFFDSIELLGIINRQMPICRNDSIIRLLSYSVQKAYSGLDFDFARVFASRADWKKLFTDEEFHIRRSFFLY